MSNSAFVWVSTLLVLAAVASASVFGLEGAIGFVSLVGVVVVGMWLSAYARTERAPLRSTVPSAEIAREEEGAPSLTNLIIAAIALRLVIGLVLNLTGLARDLAPDSIGFQKYGDWIALNWDDPRFDPGYLRGYKTYSFYQYLNAIVSWTFGQGNSALVLSGLNAFIGTLVAWIVSRIALDLYGPHAARRAFILSAFFPSLVLWTSINLRDGWSFLAVTTVVLAVQKLRRSISFKYALLFAAAMLFLPFLRWYMLVLVGTGLGASLLVTRIRQLPYALLSFVLLVALLGGISSRFNLRVNLEDPTANLELMQRMKQGLGRKGTRGYDKDVDISNPVSALTYLPRGIALFLMTPLPWTIEKPRQLFALLETFVWYFMMFFGMRAAWKGLRTRLSQVATPLMVAAVITMAYGLVSGNEGTAYRHRGQVLLLVFVFSAGDYAERRRLRANGMTPLPRRAAQEALGPS